MKTTVMFYSQGFMTVGVSRILRMVGSISLEEGGMQLQSTTAVRGTGL